VVCRSVGQSVGLSHSEPLSPAKTAEPIEMLFGLRTRAGPVLDGGSDTPMGRGNFEGKSGVPL